MGDCLTVTQKKMMDKLVDLFTEADMDRDGSLSLGELEGLFKTMLPEYPHLQPYSHGVKRLMRQVLILLLFSYSYLFYSILIFPKFLFVLVT